MKIKDFNYSVEYSPQGAEGTTGWPPTAVERWTTSRSTRSTSCSSRCVRRIKDRMNTSPKPRAHLNSIRVMPVCQPPSMQLAGTLLADKPTQPIPFLIEQLKTIHNGIFPYLRPITHPMHVGVSRWYLLEMSVTLAWQPGCVLYGTRSHKYP